MTAVKVVLSNGDGDELELGPFSQGVVMEEGVNAFTYARVFDVASRKEVARLKDFRNSGSASYVKIGEHGGPVGKLYRSLFVHAAPAPTEESTVEHYANGDRRTIDGIPMLYQSGEWLADGECRVDDDGNGAVLISVSRDMDGERKECARICDIFGGHRRSVPREEWESWER